MMNEYVLKSDKDLILKSIEKCPYCGSPDASVEIYGDKYFVICPYCETIADNFNFDFDDKDDDYEIKF